LAEPLVAHLEKLGVRVLPCLPWKDQHRSVDALEGVQERRPVALIENIAPNLNGVRGCHSEYKRVERSVVDGAHCDPVRNDGFATVRILFDVGSIEEFCMSKSADRALPFIGQQDSASKVRLVEATSNDAPRILRRRTSSGAVSRTSCCQAVSIASSSATTNWCWSASSSTSQTGKTASYNPARHPRTTRAAYEVPSPCEGQRCPTLEGRCPATCSADSRRGQCRPRTDDPQVVVCRSSGSRWLPGCLEQLGCRACSAPARSVCPET